VGPFLAFALVGALIATRRPENPIGWLFCAAGFVTAATNLVGAYAYWGIVAHPGSLPGARLAEWSGDVWYTPTIPLTTTSLFLLFPDGRLPSRRWMPVLWAAIIGSSLAAFGNALSPTLYGLPTVRNPILAAPKVVADSVSGIGFLAVIVSLIASIASLVVRYRRSRGEEREQLKWFAFAAMSALIFVVPTFAGDSPPLALIVASSIAVLAIPAAVAIAILKYRLYDIDVVINKTVVYGGLGAFVTAAYVGIVVGIGSLAGRGDKPNVPLSIAATAIVAIGFQPVRDRMQRFANRLVYGQRATPYEVLSEFSERMGGTYASEELLPRMARILAEGTGATRADVWLKTGGELRVDASWPADAEPMSAVPAETLPEGLVPVRHQGDLLGALSIEKKPGEQLTPTEEKLVHDLASQAGLVLRNVGLTEQLLAKLDELRASRQRIVAAQDEERRKLERNIHDGAQQQLVALAVKLRIAEQLVDRDAAKAREMVAQVQTDAQDALENLRDLARGIYPPLLADKGLAAALQAQARKSAVPVAVEADGVGRYPQETEAAVYFCVLEALQNVSKYAEASSAEVRLSTNDDRLTVEVEDDGCGFDVSAVGHGTGLQGMADRLAAIGGTLEVRSAPGSGTTIAGRVPVRERTR
jgi:signal transduction histidine kinase